MRFDRNRLSIRITGVGISVLRPVAQSWAIAAGLRSRTFLSVAVDADRRGVRVWPHLFASRSSPSGAFRGRHR
jgi:hypothetical protein